MSNLPLLTLLLGTSFWFAQSKSPYRIFFTTHSAKVDTVAAPREDTDDETNPVTYTVALDLNGDRVPEKFVANGGSCGSGGCPWIIHDGKTQAELGEVDGIIVYVLKEKRNGFPLIETYWKLGGSNAVVHYYTFIAGQYKQSASKDLDEQGMQEYFESKPPIADEFKELK